MLKLLLALLLVLPADPPIAPEPTRFAEGQVWEYRTRPGDEGSLLKIQRVEAGPDGSAIYHISVIGVRLGGQAGVQLQHLPVSAETLNGSHAGGFQRCRLPVAGRGDRDMAAGARRGVHDPAGPDHRHCRTADRRPGGAGAGPRDLNAQLSARLMCRVVPSRRASVKPARR